MRERPVLFSAPMVRAILASTKVQTRRAMKPQPHHVDGGVPFGDPPAWALRDGAAAGSAVMRCPYGRRGDRLWVRETLRPTLNHIGLIVDWHYAADSTKVPRCPHLLPQFSDAMAFAHLARKGVPSIHMPRWASRITLEVTGVRVERLQDIGEADAISEGIAFEERFGGYCLPDGSHFHVTDARQSYWSLWESINGPGSVDANPWVWAIDFRVETGTRGPTATS